MRLAREADLGLLALPSARALGITLCWFLACADRRVRDQATKGLVRLIMAKPDLGTQLVRWFAHTDDDYVLERVLTAAYGAGLLLQDQGYWRPLGDSVYALIFKQQPGPPTNALIRDFSRLIVEKWREADPVRPTPDLSAPPFASPWPLQVASASWSALRRQYRDFHPNMFIEPNVASDFGRYIVLDRVLANYDLAAAGLSPESATRWIFEETVRLGYPSPTKWGLAYDWNLHKEQGSGRGAPSYAERLGKKYAWIQLARMAGQLADHAPPVRRSWDPAPPPTPLQATSLRAIDPTVGVVPLASQPEVRLARFLVRPSPRYDVLNDSSWVAGAEEYAFVSELDGWTVLSLSFSGTERDEEDAISWDEFRSEDVLVTAFAANSAKLRRWSPVSNGRVPEAAQAPGGLFMAELGFAYAETRFPEYHDSQELLGLAVRPVFRRANSTFEKDYSGDALALWAPSEDLLAAMGARWDGNRAWRDEDGKALALHIEGKELQGLVARTEPLDGALKALALSLVWSMWASRTAKRALFHGYHDQRRVVRRQRRKLVEVWSKNDVSGPPNEDEGP